MEPWSHRLHPAGVHPAGARVAQRPLHPRDRRGRTRPHGAGTERHGAGRVALLHVAVRRQPDLRCGRRRRAVQLRRDDFRAAAAAATAPRRLGRGVRRVISDYHFAVQLNRFVPAIIFNGCF